MTYTCEKNEAIEAMQQYLHVIVNGCGAIKVTGNLYSIIMQLAPEK